MPEKFDEVQYRDHINDGMFLKGNDHDYFNEYKVDYIEKYAESYRTTHQKTELKILDYGCGVGLLSETMFRRIPNIVIHGFDISRQSIARVSDTIRVGKNRFTTKLEELDKDYDIVILCTVLHHISKEERGG